MDIIKEAQLRFRQGYTEEEIYYWLNMMASKRMTTWENAATALRMIRKEVRKDADNKEA